MTNIWSNNKYVEITINVLLCLLGVNFLHYGQLLLPVICLIIFVDNKLKFKVNNRYVFILLVMFALSFCIFSYKLGFYCVMGFCMPMAYYIGSNIKNPTEDNIKKIIYIFIFSMSMHVILNFIYDYCIKGFGLFTSNSHYDIWTMDKISPTNVAANCVLLMGIVYYLFTYEKNKTIKIIGLLELVTVLIYNIGLGRRTPILVLIISLLFAFFFDMFFIKKKFEIKTILITLLIIISIIVFGILSFRFNVFNITNKVQDLIIYKKFKWEGIGSSRIDILLEAITLMPNHLWGGKEIQGLIGEPVHELLMDIYDYSGIIPFIIFAVYEVVTVINMIRIFLENKNTDKYKLFVFSVLLCIFMLFVVEPIMTGESLFLILSIIIFTIVEKTNYIQ